MKKYRILIICFSLLLLTICSPALVQAQPDPAGDPDAPIDGGVGLLIAAGVGYGLKKFKDNKRKKNITIEIPD